MFGIIEKQVLHIKSLKKYNFPHFNKLLFQYKFDKTNVHISKIYKSTDVVIENYLALIELTHEFSTNSFQFLLTQNKIKSITHRT